MSTVEVAGLPFRVSTVDETVTWLLDAARAKQPLAVHFANAYTVSIAHGDPDYREMLRSGVVLPDGRPVVWMMRLSLKSSASTKARPSQVAGPRVFERAIAAMPGAGVKPFFLGGTSEDLEAITGRAVTAAPGIVLGGQYSPPFAPLSNEYLDDCVRRVQASASDIVWVGLGTPKQDVAVAALSSRLGIPCVAVGAAFGFYAGRIREPPGWMQAAGLGWLYRIASEPRRLWRRYLVGNMVFLWAAVSKFRRMGLGS